MIEATELVGERVRVHLNLHRGDFSISDPKTGKVWASADDVTLSGVTFTVSETTRQRVLAKNRRRVHAWAVGTLVGADLKPNVDGLETITYNPYRAGTFTLPGDRPITEAKEVAFANRYGYLMESRYFRSHFAGTLHCRFCGLLCCCEEEGR